MTDLTDIKKALEVAENLREYTDIDANEGANRDVVAASYAACDTIVTLASTLEALQRENEELTKHIEQLQDKVNPDKDCACSYDEAGAVCSAHSPLLKAAEAEVKRLREALEEIRDDDSYEKRESFDDSGMHITRTVYGDFGEIARQALASTGGEHNADN